MVLGYNEKSKRACKIPKYVPCEQVTVNHCCDKWDSIKKGKMREKHFKNSAVTTVTNALKNQGIL